MNLRTKEAAAYLGLSASTLNKLRCFGGGPRYFKLGKPVVYAVSDLDAWMVARARASTWAENDNAKVRAVA